MMQIKKLEKSDISEFVQLIHIFKDVFENDEAVADDAQLEKLLSNPDFLVFVVTVNNEIIGGLTIYVLHKYYHSKPVAYIYDVGIAPTFQGKGYGKALIAEVCSFCRSNGFEDAYVEAESDDIDAVEFYRKTKFTYEMNATHFTYSFDNDN
jgi:aminoglycoside 3-N-acetyltransferase I